MTATDQPGEITIRVQLYTRDVYWAALFYLLNVRLLAIFAAVLCGSVYTASAGNVSQIYAADLIFLLIFGLAPWVQAMMSMRTPIMQSAFFHTFSVLGISSKFHGGNISLDWTLIRRATETRRYIAIWGKRGAPMLIPKGQLAEGEAGAVKRILRRYLQKEARLSSD